VFLIGCGGIVDMDASADATLDTASRTDANVDARVDREPADRDAGCAPYVTPSCDAGCAAGTMCVRYQTGCPTGPRDLVDLGCLPIPAECGSSLTCACAGMCACTSGICVDRDGGIVCVCEGISRRAFKRDIRYVDDALRAELAEEILATPLATYRYKDSCERRLGFIIDDMPDPSFAIGSDRTHVDEYGYESLLLAAIQEQQKTLDGLRRRIDRAEQR